MDKDWLITGLAITLGVLVVASFVTKLILRPTTPAVSPGEPRSSAPAPTKKGFWRWFWFVPLVVTIIAVTYGITNHYATKRAEARVVVISTNMVGDIYWNLPAGETFHGRREISPRERAVRVTCLNDSEFELEQDYFEFGQAETMRIHLRKVNCGPWAWSGTWSQDNPEGHGHINLREMIPAKFYSGERTWARKDKEELRGYFEVKIR